MGSSRILRSWLLVFMLLGALIVPAARIGMPIASASADEEAPIFDTDGDGVIDDEDNCIEVANADQSDTDGDGVGDACDDEPNGPPTPVPPIDTDQDGYSDDLDNCPEVANPDQADSDNDGTGDACASEEPTIVDDDLDGVDDSIDNCLGVSNPDQERAYGYNIGVACYGDPAAVTVRFVNSANWEYLPGVCFQLAEVNTGATISLCDDDASDTNVTGGIVQMTIPGGVYNMTIAAPSGYTPEANPVTLFALPRVPNATDIVLNETPVAATGLNVQSLDLDGNPIRGGVYKLFSGIECGGDGDLVATVEAIEDGNAPFNNLQPGTYCVEVQSPPAGYTLPGKTTIEEIEVYEGATQHIYVNFPKTSVPGNTQPGTNVTISGLADGNLSVTFATVIQGGETSATVENPADAFLPPTYRATTALVYNLTTTAFFENGITACVSFDPGTFPGASSVSFLYRSHGMWIDSGTSGDPASGELCGVTDNPGLIAIAEPASTATLTLTLTDSNGNPVTGKCLAFTDGYNDYLACDAYDGSFDGQMTFDTPVPVGTYDLEWALGAAAAEFFVRSAIGQSVTIPEGVSTVTQAVVLTTTVRVNITDTDGNPLSGACFSLKGSGYGQGSCRPTQNYYNVPDGTYTLTNFDGPNGYVREDGSNGIYPVEIENGQPVTINVAYRLENTPVGTDVFVEAAGAPGVTLTFVEITTTGATTARAIDASEAPALPAGFSIDGATFFEISTTAGFSGAITLCLPYDPTAFTNPADARLFHGVGGTWVDVTTSNDGEGTICGSVTSLSPFAIAEPALSAPPMVVSGFAPPVSNGEWNQVKPGSSVPLKFSITQNGIPQTSLSAITSVLAVEIRCSDQGTVVGATIDLTGSVKRTGSSFQVNWKTPIAPGRCYLVTVTASDGNTNSALFAMKGAPSVVNVVIAVLSAILQLFHAPGYWGR